MEFAPGYLNALGMFDDWFRLMGSVAETNMAAQRVIAMRMMRLSRGGKSAKREARRMAVEKVAAAAEANLLLATGGDLHEVVKHYRRAVKANETRLRRRTR
jgi:hypothetical protein